MAVRVVAPVPEAAAAVGRETVMIKGMDLPSVDAVKEAICHGGARARPERML